MRKIFSAVPFLIALFCVLATSAWSHELSPKAEFAVRVVNAVSPVNVLWVFSICLAALCILALLKEWLWFLIKLLPKEAYEILFYVVSIGFIVDAFANTITGPENASFVALTGCVFFATSVLFSNYIHDYNMRGTVYFGIVLPIFSIVAVVFNSPMIGFGAVICLMAIMGFSIWIGPLCYGFGFDNDDGLIKATTVSFMLLVLVALAHIIGIKPPPYLHVFELGALWMGSFVGYLGLLIASFTYYRGARRIPTTFVKIAMIICCIAGMFVGSIFDLGVLKTMATIFFALFVLELPAEVRPENVTAWACTGLVIAAMGWIGSLWVKSHMDLVGYWLTF